MKALRWVVVAVAFVACGAETRPDDTTSIPFKKDPSKSDWYYNTEISEPGDPVIEAVTKRLRTEEGFRPKPYADTLGVLTIGYGTNLAQGITEPQGACLERVAISDDLSEFRSLWPPYGAMPRPVQVELADMAYQLGPGRAHGFTKMLGHLAAGEWDAAADEAIASRWDGETPARAERAAAVFRAQR